MSEMLNTNVEHNQLIPAKFFSPGAAQTSSVRAGLEALGGDPLVSAGGGGPLLVAFFQASSTDSHHAGR